MTIYVASEISPRTDLAAKELRRYLYLRTGKLPVIRPCNRLNGLEKPSLLISEREGLPELFFDTTAWQKDAFRFRSSADGSLLISGESDLALLYGAYRFLGETGIDFSLYGDVIPDEPLSRLPLGGRDSLYAPSFEIRGIQPFHDFPEGPDWWSREDYLSVVTQLPKMGLNFIGFHTYPESDPFNGWAKAEPTVWIGTKDRIAADGTVKRAYPVLFATTNDSLWNYYPRNTSEFHCGAAMIFDTDVYGTDFIKGISAYPHSEAENIALFDRMGDLLNKTFSLGKELGVRSCIGTEIPLGVPKRVRADLEAKGYASVSDRSGRSNGTVGYTDAPKAAKLSSEAKTALYEGVFERIKRTHPLDYYWFWTPEHWTWQGESEREVLAVEEDLRCAMTALENVKAPFLLATCGWVLGPKGDRTKFDRMLPEAYPFSCINRNVGFTPTEEAFAQLTRRPAWEIAWLEDDHALSSPQLWAGRVLKDARDAYRYGCDGFIGIHWRTMGIAPSFRALSKAAWDASSFTEPLVEEARDYPADDLYRAWCAAQFGAEAAPAFAAIFSRLDGGPWYRPERNEPRLTNLPRPSNWGKQGPGVIEMNRRPWREVASDYAFVTDFEKLASEVRGTGARERYVYWLNQFRYMRSMGEIGCLLGEMQAKAEAIEAAPQQAEEKGRELLALRDRTAEKWCEMMTCLLQSVQTTGEYGTIGNLEMQNLNCNRMLDRYDELIARVTGKTAEPAFLPMTYDGVSRLVVTTRRSLLQAGEPLSLKAAVLSGNPVRTVRIWYRPLGGDRFQPVEMEHVSRNVYARTLASADLPAEGLEYYLEAECGDERVRFPVTAPELNQTVVIW